MAAAAKRIETVPAAAEPIAARRFGLADLSEMGAWLLWRLKDRYPHLDERNLAGWLRGMIDSNEYLFVRTRNAVALAQIQHRALDPLPIVDELFVLAKGRDSDGVVEKGALAEAAELYGEFLRWARSLGATEIAIERYTDVPRDQIKERLGRVWVREVPFAKVTP